MFLSLKASLPTFCCISLSFPLYLDVRMNRSCTFMHSDQCKTLLFIKLILNVFSLKYTVLLFSPYGGKKKNCIMIFLESKIYCLLYSYSLLFQESIQICSVYINNGSISKLNRLTHHLTLTAKSSAQFLQFYLLLFVLFLGYQPLMLKW